MPLRYRVFPHRSLVLVHYWGHVTFAESMRTFRSYPLHPDYRPGQRQILDLRAITSLERDFVALMSMQASKLDVMMADGAEPVFAFLTGNREGYELARQCVVSWSAARSAVLRIFDTEEGVIQFLGLPEQSLDDLVALQPSTQPPPGAV